MVAKKDKLYSSCVVTCGVPFLLAGFISLSAYAQVLSPTKTPNLHRRNQEATQQSNRSVVPVERFAKVVETMFPFTGIDDTQKAGLLAAAKAFVGGDITSTLKQLELVSATRPDMPPAAAMLANMCYASGNVAQCRSWLEQSATNYPDHPSSYLGFARLAIFQERVTDAAVLLEKVDGLLQEGEFNEGQQKKYRIEYLDMQANVHVKRGQLALAKQHLIELKDLSNISEVIPIRLARVEFDSGNLDACLAQLRDALRINPKMRKPELNIADLFARKGQREAATEWMDRAVSLYPDEAAVHVDHARWSLQNENFSVVQSAISKAEQLGGDIYSVSLVKGQLAFAQRQYDFAVRQFEQALQAKLNDAQATNMLALSLVENADQTKKTRALELARTNVRLYPNSPAATATLGWVLFRTGNMAQAAQAFQTIIAGNNIQPASAYYIAAFLESRGEYSDAARFLESAIERPDYFMFRAAAVEMLNRIKPKINPTDNQDAGKSLETRDSTENNSGADGPGNSQ